MRATRTYDKSHERFGVRLSHASTPPSSLYIRRSTSPMAASVHRYSDPSSIHPLAFSPSPTRRLPSPRLTRPDGNRRAAHDIFTINKKYPPPEEVELQIVEGDDNYSPTVEGDEEPRAFVEAEYSPREDRSLASAVRKAQSVLAAVSPLPYQPAQVRPQLKEYHTVAAVPPLSPTNHRHSQLSQQSSLDRRIAVSQNSDLHQFHHRYHSPQRTSLEHAAIFDSADRQLEVEELGELVDQLQMALTSERNESEGLRLKLEVIKAESSAKTAATSNKVAMVHSSPTKETLMLKAPSGPTPPRSQPTQSKLGDELKSKDLTISNQGAIIQELLAERDTLTSQNSGLKERLAAAEAASAKNFSSGSQWRDGHDALLKELANLKVEVAEYQMALDRLGVTWPLDDAMVKSARLRATKLTVAE